MKKIFCLAFAAMLCCGFVACSDDDDVNNSNLTSEEKLLVGTWTFEKGYEYGYGYYYAEDEGIEEQWVFNSNGSGRVKGRYYDGPDYGWVSESWNFKWDIVGSMLIVRDDEGDMLESRIEELSQHELVISDDEARYYYVR
ncbi:MAG: lipocalin family protein [Alistipes sp.]|nr:lipocalin family protein [Alistipes sp.]